MSKRNQPKMPPSFATLVQTYFTEDLDAAAGTQPENHRYLPRCLHSVSRLCRGPSGQVTGRVDLGGHYAGGDHGLP